MSRSTKNYGIYMKEYSDNLSLFLDMIINQISDFQFSHNPAGTASDLEHILLVECVEDPIKAQKDVEVYLQDITAHAKNSFFNDKHFCKAWRFRKRFKVYKNVSLLQHNYYAFH